MAFDDVNINLHVNTLGALRALDDFSRAWNLVAGALRGVYEVARDGADLIGGDTLAAYEEFDGVLSDLETTSKGLVTNALLPVIETFNDLAGGHADLLALFDAGIISQETYEAALSDVSIAAIVLKQNEEALAEVQDSVNLAMERGMEIAMRVATQYESALGPALSDVIAVLFLAEERTANVEAGLRALGLTGEDVELALIAYKEAQGLLNEEQADSEELMIKLEGLIKDGLIPSYEVLFGVLDDGILTLDEYYSAVLSSAEITEFLDSTLEAAKTEAEQLADALQGVEGVYDATINITTNGSVPNIGVNKGGSNDDVQFKAAGGPVMGGAPYIVGERGPELFVPNSNGTIVPNEQLGAMSAPPQFYIILDGEQIAANVIARSGADARIAAATGSAYMGQ